MEVLNLSYSNFTKFITRSSDDIEVFALTFLSSRSAGHSVAFVMLNGSRSTIPYLHLVMRGTPLLLQLIFIYYVLLSIGIRLV